MYSTNTSWYGWQKDYRFGTLVLWPDADVMKIADEVRAQLDPESATTCPAHITATQPFANTPSLENQKMLENFFISANAIGLRIGPATHSPNKKLLWLDVNPKEQIVSLRDSLHFMDLFRTDLPLTKGFIPHSTLSEKPREPLEVESLAKKFSDIFPVQHFVAEKVSWIIPDDNFIFREHRSFALKT